MATQPYTSARNHAASGRLTYVFRPSSSLGRIDPRSMRELFWAVAGAAYGLFVTCSIVWMR